MLRAVIPFIRRGPKWRSVYDFRLRQVRNSAFGSLVAVHFHQRLGSEMREARTEAKGGKEREGGG